nr:hypothetical protein [Tanacetum cinerariifolium]
MVYQNFLREFCSTHVAFDPFPSTNKHEKRLLKEFIIKFLVLNGQRPLTLDFNTFCSSTGLNYNNGKYFDHPTPEVVKKELGKIAINSSYLDKTPILKYSFPVAWRILFTYVIQVLGGNYSFIEQVNSIQQLLAYSLVTGTEVDIGEIIYSDLGLSVSTFFGCKTKERDVLNCNFNLTQVTGPEASGALSKKSKRPMSKMPPTETKSSRLRYQSLIENKGEPSYEGEPDTQPMLLTYADVRVILLSEDEAQESEEDILGAGEEMDDNPQDQTDQQVEASMSSLEKSSSIINDPYKGLEFITQLLKDITNFIKDDPAINKKIMEAFETLAKISTQTTEILSLVMSFDFFTLQSIVKNIQDHAFMEEKASAAWMKSSTNIAWTLTLIIIKFLVLNGQRPLTLEFNTFCSSTGLNYNNGKYFDHPTPEVVKKELGKIAINSSYLDKIPILKNSFPVAWRILFTYVIQVLDGNYSFIEQVNSIQQLLAYSLITGTEVDIGEIIYSDLVTKQLFKSRLKYGLSVSTSFGCKTKERDVLNCNFNLTQVTGPEASGALSKKSKRPMSKMPPTETKSSRLRYQSLIENKGEPSYEGEPDTQPMLLTYADVRAILLSEDEAQESEEDILGAGEEMDDNPQKYDDTLHLTERQLVKYLRKVSRGSLYKLLEKSSSTINDPYKGLEFITQLLKDITNFIKDDPAINKKIMKAFETLAKISTQTTEILSLVMSFDFFTLQSIIKNIQDHAFKEEKASAAWMKSSTNIAWTLTLCSLV